MKIRSKIHPKGDRKQDASWDGVWMALGSIFGRFWIQVGRQVEAKLEPKSTKMAFLKEIENMIRKNCKKKLVPGDPQTGSADGW